jgi:hypothetical protein
MTDINYTHQLPNTTHYQNALGFFTYANDVSNNLFGIILFITLTIIYLFNAIQVNGVMKGLLQGCFLSWITAIILGVGGIIQPQIIVITTFLLFGIIILYYYNG